MFACLLDVSQGRTAEQRHVLRAAAAVVSGTFVSPARPLAERPANPLLPACSPECWTSSAVLLARPFRY